MSNSAWDEQIIIKGAGIAEGTYDVTLVDIQKESKVVMFREGLRDRSTGKAYPGIINQQYDSLDADKRAIVDSVGDEFWPLGPNDKEPRKKVAFVDQYRFVFNEPKSGTDLNKYNGSTFVINNYDASGNRIGGGKALTDFIARATGVPITPGDEFKLSDFFKPGDKYVISIVTKGSYKEIDPNSIVRKELAKPIVKGPDALSPAAKEMLDWLKVNYQGRPKKDILELYDSGQFGDRTATVAKWQEIMKNITYTKDGKTLDFSEA